MQLLRQPDAQPYEIVRLPENPLRHLTHCLSFLCVLTKILCVKYAVTPLNGNAGARYMTTVLTSSDVRYQQCPTISQIRHRIPLYLYTDVFVSACIVGLFI